MNNNLYDLTNPQKSIWQTEQFYKGMSIENITGSVIISQKVNFVALKKAINLFVKKNESFRLKFVLKDGVVKQFVDSYAEFGIETVLVSSDKDVKNIERQMCDTPFETLENFLFNFKMFKFKDGHGGFIINAHHLISDAWTAGLVVNEIINYYFSLLTGENITSEINPSYIEYIESENKYLNSEKFKKDKLFWNDMFSTIPEIATIPSFNSNKDISCKSKRKEFIIPKETISLINDFCKKTKASIFNFFMGVFSLYLSRVSGLDEFVIGTPILNRSNFKEKQTTGMFISTVPFKILINNDEYFSNFIAEIADKFSKIFRHQKYPYQYLLEDLRSKDNSIPNLYNIAISYQNVRSNKQTSNIPYTARWIANSSISDDIDVHLYDMNDTGNITIAYDYLISKYSIDDICSIHARILYIINQILENKEIYLKDIEIVTPDEKHKILYEFNDTQADYPKDKNIAQLFEEQVEKAPDNIAVVFKNQKLSYKELNQKSNSLAHSLLKKGIKKGDIIPVIINRSVDLIISIIGIIKIGAIYLPISLETPSERIKYILKDSSSKLILSNNTMITKLVDDKIDVINLDTFNYNEFPNCNPNVKINPNDLLYIIYTSGSTGKPKGVKLTHRNLNNLIFSFNKLFGTPTFEDRCLASTNISFDVSIWEFFFTLLSGAQLYLFDDNTITDVFKYCDSIINNKITMLYIPPNILENVFDILYNKPDNKYINKLLLGVEPIKNETVKKYFSINPNMKIINAYGPTETTICCTAYPVTINNLDKHIILPIGKPLSNLKLYVLDKFHNVVPIGVPGELYVTGDNVSAGYLNNKNITMSHFVNIPFSCNIAYKTGDIVKFNNTGDISFIGRKDNQVKINGHRIELDEIKAIINSFPDITKCVVVVVNKKLIAYFTAKKKIAINNLLSYIQKSLPKYSIPNHLIQLSNFKLTNNGKIDTAYLKNMKLNIQKNYVAPQNELQKTLVQIFESILNIDNIGINDSFFELGGDSLASINLCTRIYNKLNVQIYVKDILENPIIRDLSDLISFRVSNIKKHDIQKATKAKYYPVSSAEKRIFFSSKALPEENLAYNISGALLVDTLLDKEKIQKVITKLIDLQPSFKTRFVMVESELMQEVIENVSININSFNDSEKNIHKIVDSFPKIFDLSTAPLLRVEICYLDNSKTLILLDTHHIIMDGVSLNIFMRDFCRIYNDENLEDLKFDYIDYSVWEKNYLSSDEIKENEKYWNSVCSNPDISTLNLPYDYSPSKTTEHIGDKILEIIPDTLFKSIQNLSKSMNVSEYTVFITALYILLYKYTSQTDIIIGSPLAGRDLEEFSNVIGMFVNNIILRENIDVTSSINSFLKTVQNTVTNAISNQPYPYELIAKKLNNNPSLLDVVLTYQNNKKDEYKIENSKLELLSANTHTSKFNIWFEIIPETHTINLEYNSSLFKKETIESFLKHYIFILEQVVNKPELTIEDTEIITPNELKMLEKFNNTDGPINGDTVVSIFEEQVKKHPNNIAIICNDQTLTYGELNKKANSLAHLLIQKGIGRNDIVCIMTNRSFETIVCMMAILKAGAAFFNVDPTYPIERTKYYLEDSKTKYVLTQRELKDRVSSIENCIEIDLSIEDIYNKNFENPNVKVRPEDLSYLIYTSGSTGKPKGVMLNQVGFANMVKAMTLVLDYLKEGNKHCIASVTSTPFDIFVYEIIVSLTHGLKIAMANNAEHRNPKLLDELIRKCNVDVMTVTPSLMKINYDNRQPNTALALVKNMVFGGEPLPEKFVKDLRALADDITIYNIYGPSEITILSNVQNLDGETEITTGPPIMNTQIHILDKNMKRVPIGVVGEIYISGVQVGLGYMGKPELTAEKFLDNPFGTGKMYKSGDIGRWTFDGKVQCLGRIDNQIKLRGLRIELGEIENIILNTENVSSAVVNKIEIDGKEALCAYYTCEKDVAEEIVRENLRKALPPYMVPAYIVKLDKMPYTINRKIDRKALPLPEINKPVVNNKVNIDELNSTEEKLLQIWKNILKIDDIDINDNFFDIGGDSVAAISMQIEAVKYGLEFEYGDIFAFPTIKQLSANLKTPDEVFIKNYDYSKVNSILARNNTSALDSIKNTEIKNILLIGSTGYLGAHILDAFLKTNTGVAYCLVREKNGIDIKKRLENVLNFYFDNKYEDLFDKRIKVVSGDIVKANLGLSKDNYDIIKNDIDVVINSGALVKHFGIKKKFEDINVNGTNNIIDFCLNTNKRLLHVSTISVSGNGEKEETVIETPQNINDKKIFKETDIYVGQNIKGVYSTTKFRAELLVLEAISNKNLDAQILRLGNITNRYSDGLFQMNIDENAFAKRIKSFVEIGAIPNYLLKHSIELTPVDLAAEAIIKIANYTSNCNVIHIYNTKLMPIKLFINTLYEIGINLLPVPEKMMIDIITGILADNSRKEILSGIIYDLNENKELIYTSNIRINCDFSTEFFKKIGFEWKPIDKDYIMKYMNYFNKIKFIEKGEI